MWVRARSQLQGVPKAQQRTARGAGQSKTYEYAATCPPIARVKPVALLRLRPLTGPLGASISPARALLRVGLVSSLSAPIPRPAPRLAPLPGHYCPCPATGAAAAPAAGWYRGQRCPEDVPGAHARAARACATRARAAQAHAEPPTARSHWL